MFLNITIDNVLGISNEIELNLIAESKRSSKKETVYNISRGLNVNKINGIIGPNASGKSSILHTIAGIGNFLSEDINMKELKNCEGSTKNTIVYDISGFLPKQYDNTRKSKVSMDLYITKGNKPGFYRYSIEYTSNLQEETKVREKLEYKTKYNNQWEIKSNIEFKEYRSEIGYKCNHYESIANDYKQISEELYKSFEDKMQYYKTFYYHYIFCSHSQLSDDFITPISELYLECWLEQDEAMVNKIIRYIDKKVNKIYLKKIEDSEIIKVDTVENKMIDFYDLSQGTRKFLMFMYSVIRVIQNEGILICDEIENSLHIDLVRFILKMFKIDNNASQIIYTANTESAMDEKIIRKDQINIIERENGILKIIKFSEIARRNDTSFNRAYSSKSICKQQPDDEEINRFISEFDISKIKKYGKMQYIMKPVKK